jgi:hypothetical protein
MANCSSVIVCTQFEIEKLRSFAQIDLYTVKDSKSKYIFSRKSFTIKTWKNHFCFLNLYKKLKKNVFRHILGFSIINKISAY